eukprot:TRINITY_DN3589_c0_g1_i1.p1 TRINITY_DN3589_c0_g1~~TRINITY_DN3589_c0_g1_i1.p1  ORF type:complete len:316 (-),score=42.92 TRINITY_DN3589_c0_g1_i1:65-1012(-)
MEQRNIEAPFNASERILIKSPESLKAKLSSIKADGPSKLSIITDFDDTLTKMNHLGKMADNSFRVIESPAVVGPAFGEKLLQFRYKYLPLEKDIRLTKEEKEAYMIEWRKAALALFVDSKLTKERIRRATMDSKLFFRYGCANFLKTVSEANLKLHLVSGGVKAVVTESLKILESTHKLSLNNFLAYCMTPDIYNEEEVLIGFGEPTLITGNKQEFVTHELYPDIIPGNNAIVMGDLIEDFWVIRNLKLKTVIGIGFVGDESKYNPELLRNYMDTYDIIIANDGNMTHATELVKYLLGMEIDPEYNSKELMELYH